MLGFRDFVPIDNTRALALSRTREDGASLLARINDWIATERVDVVNVETLLLPAGTADKGANHFNDNIQLAVGALEIGTPRLQVIRVWFRTNGTD